MDSIPIHECGPKVSNLFSQQVAYFRMIRDGQSHNMAELLAVRKFPGVHGLDSAFMAGTHHQDSLLDHYRYRAAAEAGVDTNGRRYLSGMARFPNDPEAWVSSRDDVVRLCAERGWNCHGLVEHEAPAAEPTPDIPIAPEIVDQHVEACLRAFDPGEQTPQLKADIRERVTQELTGELELDDSAHVRDYEYSDAVALSESDG